MKKVAIAVLLIAAVPLVADAQLLRRIFGGGSSACGPAGCSIRPMPMPAPQPDDEPEAVGAAPAGNFQAFQLNGVNREKINGTDECHYSLGGRKASQYEARGVLEDDSKKHYLVLSGDGREKVEADLKADPKCAGLLSRTRVWSVPAGHFSLLDRDTGKLMYPVGSPGIFFAQADGSELFSAKKYDGPVTIEAIRKADPLSDEKKADPVKLHPTIPAAVVVGAGLGLMFIVRKRAKP